MLRGIEKEKLTDGMYVRFTMSVLSDGNYIPDLIQLLEKEESVKYIEAHRLDEWVHKKAIQKAIESFRVTEEHKAYLRTLR